MAKLRIFLKQRIIFDEVSVNGHFTELLSRFCNLVTYALILRVQKEPENCGIGKRH